MHNVDGQEPMPQRVVTFLLALLSLSASVGCTPVVREVTYEMTWEAGDPFFPSDVSLTFVDYPNDYVHVRQTDLARYLHERGHPTVPAVFEITTVRGCRQWWRLVQVGERRSWIHDQETVSTHDGTKASEWGESGCWFRWLG